ncbi:MAG: DUF523 and DUF1722 domain-containing protein, partial [Planctomycetales bacterium]
MTSTPEASEIHASGIHAQPERQRFAAMNDPTESIHLTGMQDQGSRDATIRIGISACLLGEEVRYDGGHKRDRYLTDVLGAHVEWVPVCPEVEFGLGTPRETIELVQMKDGIALRTTETRVDLPKRMRAFAKSRAAALAQENISGHVLKRGSPSCGMTRVKIQQSKGPPRRSGVGLFAEALLERFPNLPVEEEGRLGDGVLRENWIERVFAYHALQGLWSTRWKLSDLAEFHALRKLQLLAHSDREHRELSRLITDGRTVPRAELRRRYEAGF